jgi:hypothetical protein
MVGMSPRDDHVDRRRAIRIVLEDTKSLLRPTDFAAFDVPTKTAGLAKSLGLCEIGLAAAQGVLRPLATTYSTATASPNGVKVSMAKIAAANATATSGRITVSTIVWEDDLRSCSINLPVRDGEFAVWVGREPSLQPLAAMCVLATANLRNS